MYNYKGVRNLCHSVLRDRLWMVFLACSIQRVAVLTCFASLFVFFCRLLGCNGHRLLYQDEDHRPVVPCRGGQAASSARTRRVTRCVRYLLLRHYRPCPFFV